MGIRFALKAVLDPGVSDDRWTYSVYFVAKSLAQEMVFILSMTVICSMLVLVTRELATETKRAILFTAIIIFAFRATPSVGDAYFW